MAELILVGGPPVILIGCVIFLSSFLDVIRMSMSTVSFLAELDFLPVECSHLNYDVNGFKCRVNRHLFSLDSF